MKAYAIVDIEILDPVKYEQYRQMAATSIAQYGGSYVVRGGRAESLEGGWTPKRMIVLEFASMERARAWYNSPEYAAAKAIRKEAARAKMIIVEGV